ncbi:MAG TPA: patatin-like phospholipase family protein [Pyrinomonadaceae bacterium]
MSAQTTSDTPFKEIALTLSGGGYRAAAFHLGTVDCLKRLGLLDNVTMLSTVSGGTITGMMYAVSVTEGRSYQDFYDRLYSLLLKTDVIKKALDSLYTIPGADKTLSLIRSAAQVYADDIFGDQTLALLYTPAQSRFKELIFNATEFRTGNSFRFQRSQSVDAVIGNALVPINRDVALQSRLADILAASSCFPGGFEPLRFPDDFQWLAGNDLAAIRQMLGPDFKDKNGQATNVALMDGGIYDNQGLEGILLASKRRADTKLDLLIVSDTNQRNDSIYQSPKQERKGRLTLNGLSWIMQLIMVLSILTAAAVLRQLIKTLHDSGLSFFEFIYRQPSDFIYLHLMPLLLAAAVGGTLSWAFSAASRNKEVKIEGANFKLWPIVRRLTIPDLLDLLRLRFDSLMAITSYIFMKRIRALNLSGLMEDPDLRNDVLFNVLYEMELNHPKLVGKDPETEPTNALKQVAARAEAVETKLWVTNQQELNNLIACGQATTCFNILKFLWEKRTAEMQAKSGPLYALYLDALKLWKELKQEPTRYAAGSAVARPDQ